MNPIPDRLGQLVDVVSPPGRRHVALLVVLVLFFLLSPWAGEFSAAGVVLAIGFTVVVLAAVMSARGHPALATAAVVLAAPALLSTWLANLFTGLPLLDDVSKMLLLAFHISAVASLIDSIARLESSNFDTICGAIACYLMMAEAWAISYFLIESMVPGSLLFPVGQVAPGFADYLYFSLTTLTTLGYGDITPVRPFVRIWATLQAATGTIYIAVMIARLVSLHRR